MIKAQLICWRDIPVQVRVKNGRLRQTHPLTPRFQKTVYRAAFRAKAINGNAYTDSWRTTTWQTYEQSAAQIVNEIEADYSDKRLDELARNKGFEKGEEK